MTEKVLQYRKKFRNNRKWNGWRYGVFLFFIGVGIYVACMIVPIMHEHPQNLVEAYDCVFRGFLDASFIYGIFMTIASVVFSIKTAPSYNRDPNIFIMQRHSFTFRIKWRARAVFCFPFARMAVFICFLSCYLIPMPMFVKLASISLLLITGLFTIITYIDMGTKVFNKYEMENLEELEFFYGRRFGNTVQKEGG
jgi:hypothetical protein